MEIDVNAQELREEIKERAVDSLAKTLVGDYYTKQKLEEAVADRVAEKVFLEHGAEIMAKIDVDSLARLATVRLLAKVVERI